MTFRFDTKHLSGQQQAIIRKRDEEDRRRKEEYEKLEKLKANIINLLKEENQPLTLHEISDKLNVESGKVLKAINSIPHNIIKRELPDKKLTYELKQS